MWPRVRLRRDVARNVRAGHPWIYRDALSAPSAGLSPGSVVEVLDPGGSPLALGFFDPDGPIAVRVLSEPAAPLDEVVETRLRSACALRRAAARHLDSDAIRLVHGENDRLPGLVVDRYGEIGVVRLDGPAAGAFWRPRLARMAELCGEAGYPLRSLWGRGPSGRGTGSSLLGKVPPGAVVIEEGWGVPGTGWPAARVEVDVVHGQKTGLFLDQRENRRRIGRAAAGASVLNLFGYTGGFSIAAGLGGARATTTVDVAAPATAAARRNLALSGLRGDAHEAVTADVFDYLAAAGGRTWDLVVCDPPSFAPNARSVPAALAAYRRLAAAAARVLSRGGLLAAASCSSHVGVADFTAAIAAGLTDAGRDGLILETRGPAQDHPELASFPEGRYLKMVLLVLD